MDGRVVAAFRAPRSAARATTSATSATGAAGTPASVSRACQCAVSCSRERSLEDRTELVAVAHAIGVGAEAGVVDELGQPDDGADRGEQAVVAAGDHQLAVARREHLVGRHHREPRALAVRHGAVGEVAGEVVADVAERGLVERDVDHRALAAAAALEQRGEHPERRPGARALVDQRRADADARPAGLAGHRDQPARRLHQRVVAGLVAERPDVAVRADRAVDEPRVARPAARRRRGRARRRAPGGGSAGRRRRRRRAGAAPRGRAGRGARAPASACPRSRRGTSCPRRSRTAAPRPGRRRRCRGARP